MAIVGQRELEGGVVSLRLRTGDQESGIPLEVFAVRVLDRIKTKSLDL
jgi:threonyl-tRNA synthetase